MSIFGRLRQTNREWVSSSTLILFNVLCACVMIPVAELTRPGDESRAPGITRTFCAAKEQLRVSTSAYTYEPTIMVKGLLACLQNMRFVRERACPML